MKSILAKIVLFFLKVIQLFTELFKFFRKGIIKIGSVFKGFLKRVILVTIKLFEAISPVFKSLYKPIKYLKDIVVKIAALTGLIIAKSVIFAYDKLKLATREAAPKKSKASKETINPLTEKLLELLSKVVLFFYDRPILLIFSLAFIARFIAIIILKIPVYPKAYNGDALNILNGGKINEKNIINNPYDLYRATFYRLSKI